MLLPEDTSFTVVLIINLVLGILLIIGGLIYIRNLPKEINQVYGYRTKRTMANQEIWDYAQPIGARMIIYWGIGSLILGLITAFLFPSLSIIIMLMATVLGCVIGLFWSERQLDKKFDKKGNPL